MSETVDRRRFRSAAALALLVGAGLAVGCGGGATSPSTTPPLANPGPAPVPAELPPGAVAGAVSGNHDLPHRAVITAAQLRAGAALTLDITGESLHAHEVSFTGAEVTQIAGGVPISRVSSTNPHSLGHGLHNHTITFNN